jgi:hypothetical protein
MRMLAMRQMMVSRWILAVVVAMGAASAWAQPLPSWTEGSAKEGISKLDKALDDANAKGWTVVDMKKDWNKVFAFQ